jgi:hypothetical protein
MTGEVGGVSVVSLDAFPRPWRIFQQSAAVHAYVENMAPIPPPSGSPQQFVGRNPDFEEGLERLTSDAPEGHRSRWERLLVTLTALAGRGVICHVDDGPPATISLSASGPRSDSAWRCAYAALQSAIDSSRLTVEVTGSEADGWTTVRLLKPKLVLVR